MKRGYAELELARVRVDPSRYPVAEARFREVMRIGGADALALRGLAGLAAARHRFDQSLELAQRARKLDPMNAAVYGLIGDASLELVALPSGDRCLQPHDVGEADAVRLRAGLLRSRAARRT